jgi:hypothetical protein
MHKPVTRTPGTRSLSRRPPTADEPDWLQKCEHTFLRTGKLNLSAIPLPDLTAIKSRPSLKELNISKTRLESLQGLAPQRNIAVFNADHSALNSFVNFSAIANASIYSLKNTPLSTNRLFRIAIVLLSNSNRPIVNGALISDAERNKAAMYPQFTGELLNLGWELCYPCPDPDVMRELCRQYNVTYVEDEPDEDETPLQEGSEGGAEIAGADYLAQIDWLMGQHNDVILRATRRFELLDESEEKFQADVRDILAKRTRWQFVDGDDLDEQICSAVAALCVSRSDQ